MKTVHSSQFTVHPSPIPLPQGEGVRGRAGFTIIELLIAIVITALATAAVYTSFIVQQRSFTSQDQLAETQVSSRIAFNMIANDIRNAGFGYPADENPTINGSTGLITVNNAAGPNNSDTIVLLGGFRQLGTLSADAVVGQNSISISYSGSTYFNLGSRSFLNIEGLDFVQITDCTFITGTSDCSSGSLTLDSGINRPFPSGRPVYLVESITYQIIGSDLQRVTSTDTDVIANNIEDFQVASIDQDGDSKTDRVRISLLARTAGQDQTLEPSTKPYYSGITLEGNTTANTDRFRRRIWSMEIALRNPR